MDNKLTLFTSLAKPDLLKVAGRVSELVEAGEMDALKAYAIGKGLAFVAKTIIDKTESEAIDKALSYNKADRTLMGSTFTYTEGGAMYDYAKDEEYNRLASALAERKTILDEAIKAKSGKALTEGGEVVDKPPLKGYKKNSLNFRF